MGSILGLLGIKLSKEKDKNKNFLWAWALLGTVIGLIFILLLNK